MRTLAGNFVGSAAGLDAGVKFDPLGAGHALRMIALCATHPRSDGRWTKTEGAFGARMCPQDHPQRVRRDEAH